MAIETLYDKDGSITPLQNKVVAVIGYGSQGHAHAQNLRDSGIKVIVANRTESANGKLAIEHGFNPVSVSEAVKQADVIAVTLPDEVVPSVFNSEIAPNLKDGATLLMPHGFNIHFRTIEPKASVNVVMVAPKGPGHTVRYEYEKNGGVPCLLAVGQDATGDARDLAMAYAIAIGGGRSGILETTFEDECVTDLFGEQVVLCGGLAELIKLGYETLVEAGYPGELAYFETCHEVKLIVDLVVRGGLNFMNHSVSNTAEFGGYYTGTKIIDADAKERMKTALKHIQDGGFAKAFRDDYEAGFPWFKQQKEAGRTHAIEEIGVELRERMPWINPVKH